MLRQGLFAFMMLVLCITFVTADTIKGKITKIDETDGVTVMVGKDKDAKTFKIAKDCKVCKTVKKDDKEEKEEIKEGLKADVLSKLPEKGLNATLTTNDKNEVTEIVIAGKKKKGS